MKCPGCSADVYWKRGDTSNTVLTFDPGFLDTYIITQVHDFEILEIAKGMTYTQHDCGVGTLEEAKDDDELRQTFWEHARIVGLLYACPTCSVGAHQGCLDMRYTVKEHLTEWPHKERFINYVDEQVIARAKKRGWL